MMEVLRTPDERFANLPGYAFSPRYAEVPRGDGRGTLRMHYLDEGPSDATETVLCLHGEPSWSYLYRHMIPVLVAAGHRVIAPDLVGFGRSDKPGARADYTYQRHVDWMKEFISGQDLSGITLVGQDWGGLIGLRIVGERPVWFRRVVAANTLFPTGDADLGDGFKAWRTFSQEVPDFPTGRIVNGGCTSDLADDVIAAYDAPFPDESYKEGARQFPLLVTATPDDPSAAPNRAAWKGLEQFDRPFLTAFSDNDPVTGGGHRVFQARVPGANGQPHTTITGGGHFLQEERGPELAAVVNAFIASTPV